MAKVGDRIRVVHFDDLHATIRPGDTGTITRITPVNFGGGDKWTQYEVSWEGSPSGLMLCCPPDDFQIIDSVDA